MKVWRGEKAGFNWQYVVRAAIVEILVVCVSLYYATGRTGYSELSWGCVHQESGCEVKKNGRRCCRAEVIRPG